MYGNHEFGCCPGNASVLDDIMVIKAVFDAAITIVLQPPKQEE